MADVPTGVPNRRRRCLPVSDPHEMCSVMQALAAVVALMLIDPVRVIAQQPIPIDTDAVTRGIATRLGEAGVGWTVEIRPHPDGVLVYATAPGWVPVETVVQLDGEDADANAIAVAATVSLEIESAPELPDAAPVPEMEVEPAEAGAETKPAPWALAAGAVVALNARGSADVSGGGELSAGRWLGENVRVGLRLAGTHARSDSLRLYGLHSGVEVAVGARLGRAWLGGAPTFGVSAVWAREQGGDVGVSMQVQLPAVFDVDLTSRVFLRGRVGVELHGPRLRFRGTTSSLRWRTVRPLAGLGFGLRLP